MTDSTSINASPTKAFFVRMLTRDIALRDAILDLLDNCIDGVVRSTHPKAEDKTPYKGYSADITATPEEFVIEDNCGGISLDIATRVAFRLGRPAEEPAEKLGTVGVYGIGMKRAIFKLGKDAVVTSEHNGTRFRVHIQEDWLSNDKVWNLPLVQQSVTGKKGTRVEVRDLYPEVKREFTTGQSTFVTDELPGAIRELFAIIMGKGFRIRLNGRELTPVEFKLLVTQGSEKSAINPYIFRGRFGSVHAEIVVGFYRKPLSESELEEESEAPRADLSQAGWSVICNDRLILRGDKSAVTGWGTGNVPRFHNQFSSIAGVVNLKSTEPELLPLNTTKRGIETSSDVYFRLLDYMRDGMKQFTDYTNKWKARSDDARKHFGNTNSVNAAEIASAFRPAAFEVVNPRKLAAENAEAKVFRPELPRPASEKDDRRKIVFTRPSADVAFLAQAMLDDDTASPGQVGEACFDEQLKKHRKSR